MKYSIATIYDFQMTTYGLLQRRISTHQNIALLQFMVNRQSMACRREIIAHEKNNMFLQCTISRQQRMASTQQ